MVVEAIQTFQFLRQKSGFLKTIKLCLNFNMGFHITQLALSNHNKISP